MNNLKLISVISSNDNEYKPIYENFRANISSFNSIISNVEIINVDTKSGNWQSQGFLDTVYKKLDHTHRLLKEGYIVFCTDLDIFYLKDPIEHMYNLIENFDIVAQKDSHRLCTGFYMVKPSDLTIDLFDASQRHSLIGEQSDQNFINSKLNIGQEKTYNRPAQFKKFDQLKIHLLDIDLFPYGDHWFRNHQDLNPYIVHYNWLSSISQKINSMKKFNHWLTL
jgi:hypothetical protein